MKTREYSKSEEIILSVTDPDEQTNSDIITENGKLGNFIKITIFFLIICIFI